MRHRNMDSVAHLWWCAIELVISVAHQCGCAIESLISVAHQRGCAIKSRWGPRQSLPLELNRNFCGACRTVRHKKRQFCGAPSSVRHRNMYFYGARSRCATEDGISMAHVYGAPQNCKMVRHWNSWSEQKGGGAPSPSSHSILIPLDLARALTLSPPNLPL